MKKLFLLIATIATVLTTTAQSIHTMNEFSNGDTLRVCQDNPRVIIQKDPTFSENPYWITENGETYHEDEVTINHQNAGWLLYTEKQPERYKNIYVLFQPLPEEETFHILIEEGEIIELKATPQYIPTFEYEWECSSWPQNKAYYGYALQINKEGIYYCFINDQCNSATIITFIVDKKPSINFVTTDLQTETPMVYWDTYPNAFFDSVAIYRNNVLVGVRNFWSGCFNDTKFEGGQPQNYKVAAWYNGSPYTNKSWSKRPIWLYVSEITDKGINYGWWEPANEKESPVEYFIRYYQLYEILENGAFGLIRSMIPANETEIIDIENDYEKVVLAAVLHDGREIFSNIVRPSTLKTVESNKAEKKIGNIYPNPTTGLLNFSEFIGSEYQIFDTQGRVVMTGTLQPQINVSDLSKGIYIIMVNGSKTITRKFILE